MLKISLLALVVVLFSGCSNPAQPLPLSKYHQYDVLYEVTYDSECGIGAGRSVIFTKGDKFVPLLVKDSPLKVDGVAGDATMLPKGTLALKVYTQGLSQYAFIYPDGSFISEYHLAVFVSETVYGPDNVFITSEDHNCKLIDGKALFKQVKS